MRSAQNEAWRHHHAPQFYLTRWVEPTTGRLLQYKRVSTGKLVINKTIPKSTGYEPHLYTAPPTTPYEHWAPDQIETDFMSPLDNAAAPVLKKMLAEPVGVVGLDDAERKAWARFIRSLLERHPKTLSERDASAAQAADELARHYKATLPTRTVERAFEIFDIQTAAKNIVRTDMVRRIDDPAFLDRFQAQQWCTFDAPEDAYITCDQPLLENPVLAKEIGTETLYLMTLPISPGRLFASYPKSWHNDPEWQSSLAAITVIHNMLVVDSAPRFLYSAKPIEDGKNAKLRKMVEASFGVTSAPVAK